MAKQIVYSLPEASKKAVSLPTNGFSESEGVEHVSAEELRANTERRIKAWEIRDAP